MAFIVSSSQTAGHPQEDGRRYVTERHLLDDGRSIEFEYLADEATNADVVLALRADRLNAELAAQSAAENEAASGRLPLTKYQFRQRFTLPERIAIDQFNNGGYLSAPLSGEQKAALGTMLEDFRVALEVRLDDPATIAAVQMYEALGLIESDRAKEILNG